MSDKPSYLGLLNAISVAEGNAECYLEAWAATTTRDDVRQVISTVALREGEHAKAFAKRMCELGYEVNPREDPTLAEKMAIASSTTLSDLTKFQKLDLARPVDPDKPDIFAGMFADCTIDIQTGALLGRYIAEERDSGRMFRECYTCLEAESNGSNGSAAGPDSAELSARLDQIETLLTQLVATKGSKK
jgi:rubrerythrin